MMLKISRLYRSTCGVPAEITSATRRHADDERIFLFTWKRMRFKALFT